VSPEEAIIAVIDALNVQSVPYVLVGSLASLYHGTARATQNADFVIQLETDKLPALTAQLGPRFRIRSQTTATSATTTRYLVELADKSYLIELFLLSGDSHDVERFSRRRKVSFLSRDVFLPTAEDAIITKLRWFVSGTRQKDMLDARDIIAVQGDHLDWVYVNSWCDRHGTRELLDQVRRSLQTN
jgi:hypothetical protein